MLKNLFIIFLFFGSLQSFSQKLVYNSNGNILNSENQEISPDQVRELLKENEKLLTDYNVGRKKKTVGNILLIGGSVIIGTVFTFAVIDFNENIQLKNSTKNTVKALNFIGIASLIVAIPIKMGFSKKIKNVVSQYNYLENLSYTESNYKKLDLIANSNGIGLRLTLK